MKTKTLFLILNLFLALFVSAQAPPPPDPSAPPPGAPAKRSAAELEKLVAPIALYPDPLIATLLPASVYPLEVVQAARFVSNTNNLANLDAQPWDDSVKAVARVPAAIQKLNDDLAWTIELGEAFLAQDKEVMDMIQALRGKAQKAGTLQTTPQQVVVVTNMIVETKVEQQVVVVTNTVVQIQSSSPEVVYVPSYNPYSVYYPPPAYVYDPFAPLVTFTAGVAMGAIIANNCDWHHGGCYHGDVDIDVNRNVNNNFNRNNSISTTRGVGTTQTRAAGASATGTPKKWQPDSSRLSKSGSPGATASARSMESRGWGSGGGARPSTGGVGTRPSTGSVGARPSTGNPAARPSTGTAGARPSTGSSSGNRPTASPSAGRQSPSPAASPARSGSAPNRTSSGSAFGGVIGGSGASQYGSRGASSRGSGGGFSGGGGRGGGGRGGRR